MIDPDVVCGDGYGPRFQNDSHTLCCDAILDPPACPLASLVLLVIHFKPPCVLQIWRFIWRKNKSIENGYRNFCHGVSNTKSFRRLPQDVSRDEYDGYVRHQLARNLTWLPIWLKVWFNSIQTLRRLESYSPVVEFARIVWISRMNVNRRVYQILQISNTFGFVRFSRIYPRVGDAAGGCVRGVVGVGRNVTYPKP